MKELLHQLRNHTDMLSIAAFTILAGLVSASPTKRWDVKDSQANCWNFYSDITAEADNIDLESVIGGL